MSRKRRRAMRDIARASLLATSNEMGLHCFFLTVRAFLGVCFHPDTPAYDYLTADGQRTFSIDEAYAIGTTMERVFRTFDRDLVYQVAIDVHRQVSRLERERSRTERAAHLEQLDDLRRSAWCELNSWGRVLANYYVEDQAEHRPPSGHEYATRRYIEWRQIESLARTLQSLELYGKFHP